MLPFLLLLLPEHQRLYCLKQLYIQSLFLMYHYQRCSLPDLRFSDLIQYHPYYPETNQDFQFLLHSALLHLLYQDQKISYLYVPVLLLRYRLLQIYYLTDLHIQLPYSLSLFLPLLLLTFF